MTSLKINRLAIEAFRGITDRLELDLRSPLTVVYAANGTGKTTLCDAAEWLLTAAVDRLDVQDAAHIDELRSGFRPDQSPRVEADVVVDGAEYFIERGLNGAKISLGPGETRPMGPNELLSFLAPEGAGDERHPRTAMSLRRQWLRGARFLTVEALSALLDTDKATLERRRQVFSDLLGVRAQADAKDRLRRYSDALQPEQASLRKRVAAAEAAVERARSEVTDGSDRSASDREWEAAEAALGIDRAGDRRGTVTAEIARRRQALVGARDALDAVLREWGQRNSMRRELAREAAAEQAAAALAPGERQAADMRVAQAKEQLGRSDLRARRLDDFGANLSRQLGTLASECELLAPATGLPSRPTLGLLRDAIPHARFPAARRISLTREVQGLVDRYHDVLAWTERRSEAEAELEAIRSGSPTPEARQALQEALVRAEQERTAAIAQLGRDAEPLQRLRSAGEAFLDHEHEGATCPVCGHDWIARDALLSAVRAVLNRTPEFLAAAQATLNEAERAVAEAGRQLGGVARVDERDGEITAEIARLDRDLGRFERAVRAAGIDPAPAATLAARLDREAALLRLAGLLVEMDGPARAFTSEFSVAVEEGLSLPTARSRFEAAVATRAASEKSMRDELDAALVRAREDVAAIARADAERASAVERARERQASLRSRIDAFSSGWVRVAGELPATEGNLAGARSGLEAETVLLDRAEGHLAAAVAADAQAGRLKQLEAAKLELAVLQQRLETLTGKRAAAERAFQAFDAHYQEASGRQVTALRNVVNPLFARMHANKVFDTIGFGEGEGEDLLRWHSDVGGHSFDPNRNFSQGQRQDLALALFIARARSLGGTFFLDEPVIHLDDVNRVGLLDVLRATTLSGRDRINLVVTTSSHSMARHMMEKFGRVEAPAGDGRACPALRVYELRGNGRDGVEKIDLFPNVP